MTRRFTADIELAGEYLLDEDRVVSVADFDERTGRILMGTTLYGENFGNIRLYLADLPP